MLLLSFTVAVQIALPSELASMRTPCCLSAVCSMIPAQQTRVLYHLLWQCSPAGHSVLHRSCILLSIVIACHVAANTDRAKWHMMQCAYDIACLQPLVLGQHTLMHSCSLLSTLSCRTLLLLSQCLAVTVQQQAAQTVSGKSIWNLSTVCC